MTPILGQNGKKEAEDYADLPIKFFYGTPVNSRARLLLVEADQTLLQALSRLLREICAVETATSTETALDRLRGAAFDIVLIDSDLPQPEGFWLYNAFRAEGFEGPILTLATADRIAEFSDGSAGAADDIVPKPIRMALLAGKIEVALRRRPQMTAKKIGPFDFFAADRCLVEPGSNVTIRLTEKERDILNHLLAKDGAPVLRETLLAEVWGYSAAATTHTLETHIYRLRQKLAQDPEASTLLVSEAGGYRLAV